MILGTLNYGESPYVIYFCYVELSIFHYKIDSLEEYSLATDIAMSFASFQPQYIT